MKVNSELIIGILLAIITISSIFIGISYNKNTKLDNQMLEKELRASIGFMDALRYRLSSLNYDFYLLSNLCDDPEFRLSINQETMDPNFANDLEIELSKMYQSGNITCKQYLVGKRKIYEESYLERFGQIQDLGREYQELEEISNKPDIKTNLLIGITILSSFAILILHILKLRHINKSRFKESGKSPQED